MSHLAYLPVFWELTDLICACREMMKLLKRSPNETHEAVAIRLGIPLSDLTAV